MKIVLKKDVPKLGKVGDVVKVKDGYARNYLISKEFAQEATAGNLKRLEQDKQFKEVKLQKDKLKAEELASKLSGFSCTINTEATDEDKLYGSVTNQDIALALAAEGYSIDKKSILLEEPIKKLGIYDVMVRLHLEVTTKIKVWVVKK